MRPWKKILVFPLTFMNKNRVDIKVEQTFFIFSYIIHDKDLTLNSACPKMAKNVLG